MKWTERRAVVEDLEAVLGGAGDVVVKDELIHFLLKQVEWPTSAADHFELLGGQTFSRTE